MIICPPQVDTRPDFIFLHRNMTVEEKATSELELAKLPSPEKDQLWVDQYSPLSAQHMWNGHDKPKILHTWNCVQPGGCGEMNPTVTKETRQKRRPLHLWQSVKDFDEVLVFNTFNMKGSFSQGWAFHGGGGTIFFCRPYVVLQRHIFFIQTCYILSRFTYIIYHIVLYLVIEKCALDTLNVV